MPSISTDRLVEEARQRAADRRRSFVWSPDGSPAPERRPQAASGAPLEVLLSSDERTLFNYVRDPRLNVRIHRPGAQLEARPDVVVLTRCDRSPAADSAARLPDEVWPLLSGGRAALVMDASGEGSPFWPKSAESLHGFLHSRGVRPSMAAYVTQDRGWPQAYADHCDSEGLGAERIRIWIHDLYIQRTFAEIGARGERQFQQRLEAYADRAKRRRRRFISLNRTVRPVKALFLLKLMQEGLFDSGYISLGLIGEVGGGHVMPLPEFADLLTRVRGFGDLLPQLEPYLPQLAELAPISLGYDRNGPAKAVNRAALSAIPLKEYGRSWFSVVTESHASDRLHRITEKPLKPILNFHPFLVLGCVGSLRLLRAYGFDTYPQIFDESYDETHRLRRRFDRVFEQTRRLCRISEARLARIDNAVAPTVVFNAWWGMRELPSLFQSHIDAPLIDRLVELCEARAEA